MWIDSASSLYKMFYARRKPVPGDNEVAMERSALPSSAQLPRFERKQLTRVSLNRSAKWLVAQRQIAVCSVALFLSFVLYATVALHVRVLTLEEQIAKMEGKDVSRRTLTSCAFMLLGKHLSHRALPIYRSANPLKRARRNTRICKTTRARTQR